MLTKADDYPIHQTADPIAAVGTSDRNFYDRYFFNGYGRDGERISPRRSAAIRTGR